MPRRLGDLGCTPEEARSRMERLFRMGLTSAMGDNTVPMTDRNRSFLRDMTDALENEEFEFTYGQVTYAQDLYDRFCL